MTYQEFKDANMGKYLDWDGAYGYQCWDLAQFYVTQCLDVPSWVLSGCGVAKNLLYPPKINDVLQYFDEVKTNEMLAGDICIWDFGGDSAGHIAIFDSWNGYECFYLSQNPGPVHIEVIDGGTMRAFRRKAPTPPTPTPSITPNVERDEYKDQIEVRVNNLNVRTNAGRQFESLGFATEGFYNYYDKCNNDGFDWYKIAEDQWIAYNENWETVYPAKEKDKYIQLKVLGEKDGYVLVDLGKVYIEKSKGSN